MFTWTTQPRIIVYFPTSRLRHNKYPQFSAAAEVGNDLRASLATRRRYVTAGITKNTVRMTCTVALHIEDDTAIGRRIPHHLCNLLYARFKRQFNIADLAIVHQPHRSRPRTGSELVNNDNNLMKHTRGSHKVIVYFPFAHTLCLQQSFYTAKWWLTSIIQGYIRDR